jgi:hypothetical protein
MYSIQSSHCVKNHITPTEVNIKINWLSVTYGRVTRSRKLRAGSKSQLFEKKLARNKSNNESYGRMRFVPDTTPTLFPWIYAISTDESSVFANVSHE